VDQTERQLWTMRSDSQSIECVMRSCCAGAELRILTSDRTGAESAVVLRELYPTRSDGVRPGANARSALSQSDQQPARSQLRAFLGGTPGRPRLIFTR
jgi:hypothetical protein